MELEIHPKAGRGRRRSIAITSLIDVIFILLLFFLLTSTFSRFGEVPLATALGGTANTVAAPAFLQLAEDTIALNGEDQDLATLGPALQALSSDGSEVLTVLVSLDDSVTAQRLVDLLARIRPLPDLSITVLQ